MDEDEWRAQRQGDGYYEDDQEESDPDQANLLAEKYEAVHAPMLKKKSSPKKVKKTKPKKKTSAKKTSAKKTTPKRDNNISKQKVVQIGMNLHLETN